MTYLLYDYFNDMPHVEYTTLIFKIHMAQFTKKSFYWLIYEESFLNLDFDNHLSIKSSRLILIFFAAYF